MGSHSGPLLGWLRGFPIRHWWCTKLLPPSLGCLHPLLALLCDFPIHTQQNLLHHPIVTTHRLISASPKGMWAQNPPLLALRVGPHSGALPQREVRAGVWGAVRSTPRAAGQRGASVGTELCSAPPGLRLRLTPLQWPSVALTLGQKLSSSPSPRRPVGPEKQLSHSVGSSEWC